MDGTGAAGGAAQGPADADKGFVGPVDGLAGGGGGAQGGFVGGDVLDGGENGFLAHGDGGFDLGGKARIVDGGGETLVHDIEEGVSALGGQGGDFQFDGTLRRSGGEGGLEHGGGFLSGSEAAGSGFGLGGPRQGGMDTVDEAGGFGSGLRR